MIDKGLYKDKKLTEKEKKTIKPVKQAGGMNYLGKQETVTVPKKWLSSPDHVVAELAYITPKEQKILLDANVYGSLKGKPNKGPGGIMSLQGDLGGYDASPGGPDSESGNPGAGSDPKSRVADIMTGKMNIGQTVGYTGPDPTGQNKAGDFVYEPSAFQKAVDFYNKLPTPLNIVKNIAQKFGPLNNLDFYNEKVVPAGRFEGTTFEDYMSQRMAGKIDAYGNRINRTGNGGGQNILQTGIMGVQEVMPSETKDPLSKSASLKDLDFNYGTFSNPVMYSDL
tara:strand:+ start:589 stop:1431 length:843 start_codon:yes stop_codon:yes gene_type:complete